MGQEARKPIASERIEMEYSMRENTPFGKVFVSEIYMPFLKDLEKAWQDYKKEILAEISSITHHTIKGGRQLLMSATPFIESNPQIYYLKSDQAPFGSEAWSLAVCHGLLAKVMGKEVVICPTAYGHFALAVHGVCTNLGLECEIFMGSQDAEKSNFLVHANGRNIKVHQVHRRTGTYDEALTEAMRTCCGDIDRFYLSLGSAIGPAPYPQIADEVFDAVVRSYLPHVTEQFDLIIGSSGVEMLPGKALSQFGQEGSKVVLEESSSGNLSNGVCGIVHGMYTTVLRNEKGIITPGVAQSNGLSIAFNLPGNAQCYEEGAVDVMKEGFSKEFLQQFPEQKILIDTGNCKELIYDVESLASLKDFSSKIKGKTQKQYSEVKRGRKAKQFSEMLLEDQETGKLICFVPLAFPSFEESRALIDTLIDAGVAGLELGLPFNDDFLEGMAISKANEIAINNGYSLEKTFSFLRELRKTHSIPIAISSFYDPVVMMGEEEFANTLSELDISFLMCDSTPTIARSWLEISKSKGVESAFLVSPNNSMEEIIEISKSCSSFVYVAAAKGLCGTTTDENNAKFEFFKSVRENITAPMIGGFGVNSPERALEVGEYCHGVAVGSAVLERILYANSFSEGRASVFEFVSELSAALKGGT